MLPPQPVRTLREEGLQAQGYFSLNPHLVQSRSLTSRAIPTLLLLAPRLLPGPAHNQFAFLWTYQKEEKKEQSTATPSSQSPRQPSGGRTEPESRCQGTLENMGADRNSWSPDTHSLLCLLRWSEGLGSLHAQCPYVAQDHGAGM